MLAIALVVVSLIVGFDVWALIWGLLGGAVFFFGCILLGYLSLPRRARRIHRETASLQEVRELSADETGFTESQSSGTWHPKWADMVKWDETHDLLAIYPNRISAYILPKAQLSDALISHCRERLIASGLLGPGKHRK
ncbi:MAG: YcxB family protein [Porphyrobacter sp.]|nr:YcxB family protein [Porphyrobacter sp.]